MNPSLESAKQIFLLHNVVKMISNNFFQKFDNTGFETDGGGKMQLRQRISKLSIME